ncbi:hypothetical protein [Pyruvatibacter sp.]|uniref:hypothetical protein n=1 Tax=Pyruvatibacter sp. TaxID=1981328 RepID=UPI0032EB1B53
MSQNILHLPPKSLHARAGAPARKSWSDDLDQRLLDVLERVCVARWITPTRRDLSANLDCGFDDLVASLHRLEARGAIQIRWRDGLPNQAPYPLKYKAAGNWSRVKSVYAVPGDLNDLSSQHKARSCLRCETRFMSEGPHNRMCSHCRSVSYADAVESYPVGT